MLSPEKLLNKDGKVLAFLPKPVQSDTLESNAAQNMSDPYGRERKKKVNES